MLMSLMLMLLLLKAIKKLCKVLTRLSLRGPLVQAECICITPYHQTETGAETASVCVSVPGYSAPYTVCRSGAQSLVQLLSAIRTFFYPSNQGAWSNDLGYFLTTLVTEIRLVSC